MITVISTALGRHERCLRSVAEQVGVKVEHLYIDSDPSITQLENLYREIHRLPPDRIVANLDGDDWLSRVDALAIIKRVYRDPKVWMTWGSYRHEDGRLGCAGPYAPWENPRTAPWRASHLKTYRAGLFQKIRKEDLMLDGRWINRACDQAVMFPLLEMAGPEHACYVPDVLYTYNYEASFDRFASPAEMSHANAIVYSVRNKPAYPRISFYES